MRKRATGIAMLVSIAAVAAGCGTSSSSTSAASSSGSASVVRVSDGNGGTTNLPKGKVRIALFMLSISNSWQQQVVKGAQDTAKAAGDSLQVYNANFDPSTQLNQIQNALQQKSMDAAMILPVDSSLVCKIGTQTLPQAGITTLALAIPLCGHTTDDGPHAYQPGLLTWVGSNNTLPFDRAWLDDAAKLDPSKNAVALIAGPAIIGQSQSLANILKTWQPQHPSFKIKYVVNTNFTTPDALAKTSALLKAHPNIDLIMSVYSPDLTRGVVEALQGAGLAGKIPVIDTGGSQYSYQQIRAGVLQMTLPYFPYNIGRQGVKALLSAQSGQSVPHFIDDSQIGSATNPVPITKANLSAWTPTY
jgi:ribose transport system substrate-binding protein